MGIVDCAVERILSGSYVSKRQDCDQDDDTQVILSPQGQGVIREKSPHPEEVLASSTDVLGTYSRMSSPGVLTLYVDALDSFFWHTLLGLYQAPYRLTYTELERLCRLVVLKTYYHEQFHHLCDVSRYLFGRVYNKDKEEALAVAYSHRQLLSELKSSMNQPHYAEFMDRVFRYTGQGYRDWTRFAHPDELSDGLVAYIGPMTSQKLYSCGISAETVLYAIKSAVDMQGVEEQMLDCNGNRLWPVARTWFIRPDLQPGESAQDLRLGCFISIGDTEVGDLTGQDRAGIVERVRTFKRISSNFHLPPLLKPLHSMANEIRSGDKVYVWLGRQEDQALVGIVEGGYQYVRHRTCAPHVRYVRWDQRNAIVSGRELVQNGIGDPNSCEKIVPVTARIMESAIYSRKNIELF